MDQEIPVVKNYDPEKEVQETRNSLALALEQSELGLSEEQIQVISERLVTEGVRTKDVVKRISGTSFRKGQEMAKSTLEQEFKARIDELSAQAGITKGIEATLPSSQPTGEPSKSIGPDPGTTELAKLTTFLKGEITKLRNELTEQRENERERIITDRTKSTIADLGFDNPDAVLLLARKDAAFVFDPSDGETLIAVKPGDRSQPLSGDGTYTTVKDYFESFANTPLGMKFKKVPEGAKPGAGISGIAGAPARPGFLSEENINKAYRNLGINT